ncbi:MAG: hypothetical protein ACK2UB_11750, partial [Anaerolineales bacterium]
MPTSKKKKTAKPGKKRTTRKAPATAIKRKAAAKPAVRKRSAPAGKASAKAKGKPGQAAPSAPSVKSEEYRPDVIESKWQEAWERDGLYRSVIDPDRKKFYALTMLP